MSTETSVKGTIFNIQHYSIHDGPGIRTTVFFKGCPLRCQWCQNPESQSFKPEILIFEDKCSGCGKCQAVCIQKAINIINGKSQTDFQKCKGCGQCVKVCPNEARELLGQYISPEEVFQEVNADTIFYETSGGGVTLSGGEPLAQPEFAFNILKLCQEAGLHTAIETSGFANQDILVKVLKYVDLVLYDFKQMDPERHKKYTGVSNDLILANAIKIHRDLHLPIWARLPVIPGYNDSPENILTTARFIKENLDSSVKVHLLPYHRLGESKYKRLGLKYAVTASPPSENEITQLLEVVKSCGLTVVSGG